jgi:hypothetical protein
VELRRPQLGEGPPPRTCLHQLSAPAWPKGCGRGRLKPGELRPAANAGPSTECIVRRLRRRRRTATSPPRQQGPLLARRARVQIVPYRPDETAREGQPLLARRARVNG